MADATSESIYYWVAAVTTLATTAVLIWTVYLDDTQKAAIVNRIRSLPQPFLRARARRQAQARLTYETFLVQEAMEDYHEGGHDLAGSLDLAA